MVYVLLILLIILVGILILRVRLCVVLEDGTRHIGLSLGRRSGVRLDLRQQQGALELLTVPVYRFDLGVEDKDKPEEKTVKKSKPRRKRRRLSIARWFSIDRLKDLLIIVNRSRKAVWNFVKGMLRATALEELQARIYAGLDAPDRTGRLYGYYQAVLGAVPVLHDRLVFVPNWTEASFAASGRFAAAVPLYKLIWRTVVLIWQMPSRKAIKMAIQEKKGEQDVK